MQEGEWILRSGDQELGQHTFVQFKQLLLLSIPAELWRDTQRSLQSIHTCGSTVGMATVFAGRGW